MLERNEINVLRVCTLTLAIQCRLKLVITGHFFATTIFHKGLFHIILQTTGKPNEMGSSSTRRLFFAKNSLDLANCYQNCDENNRVLKKP